ncbi:MULTISPECIES: recombinase family protein [Staphylococcus]|uniref:recombinase family protein n=1 Tax=Staphylococcus TaxID=1279 RepID=UPI0001C54CA0|nr:MULTISPECIES: recombinase family protein [Staphylococcus]ADC88377.1 Phage DNA invertase [Staphylococcus lugdunensis HKU09-01]MBM7132718.1 recombinase family protein [Staphylococcus lugdunensis]MCH8639808.1 recombinase family protein [Staphylococcus lugdunensis]MCH8641123.1 recombinase family protein [Staphylococcus lugdunensis]MCH8644451.1 recombinase family protein [Staphylococcus lugdunensis]
MKVAIYTRVSTLEQREKGHSIDEQERKLRSFCDINDWTVKDVYVDAGFSGAKRDRPELTRLLDDISEFDLVLVYKLDRLTRSVRDLLDLLEVFENNNVAFRSATEVYDTTTAIGRLFVTLVGAMAEWERETIRERSLMGKRAAIKKGMILTAPPFYYDRVNNTYIPNQYKDVVLDVYNKVKKGYSIAHIARLYNNSDVKPPNGNEEWTTRMLMHALRNPVTRGHYQWGEIYIEDSHEPIITDEMYNTIIDRLDKHTNTKVVAHTSVFRGKLICPNCGYALTLNSQKRKRKNDTIVYKTYYCNNCKITKGMKPHHITETETLRVFKDHLSKIDLKQYETQEKEKQSHVTIDLSKVMEQRKRYHKLYASGMMQENELFELIKETDEMIEEYEKQRKQVDVKEFDICKIKEIKDVLLKSWDIFTLEDKADFIQMSIKAINIEYTKLKRGKSSNSMKIKDIEFY